MESKYWEQLPYRVQIRLAVDTAYSPETELEQRLKAALEDHIHGTLYPLWQSEIVIAEGQEKHTLLSNLSRLHELEFDFETTGVDKVLFLTVRTVPEGYEVAAREFDSYVDRWTSVTKSLARQAITLSHECLDALLRVFSPLASVQILLDDQEHVQLVFKGSALPRQTDDTGLVAPGDLFIPVVARIGRPGDKPQQLAELPWTYLVAAEPESDAWVCDVVSGSRSPFGVRRRGRIEYLAVALLRAPGTTQVRFHASHDPQASLAGYEVYRKATTSSENELLGLTDTNGCVRVGHEGRPIEILYLRSVTEVLAKVPVAPGTVTHLEVPISDDSARLRAQEELSVLRERLIDVVARRNILIMRIRDRLQEGEISEARALLSELDTLPTRANFDQMLSSTQNAREHRSQNPRVQAKIDQLFADTRRLLGTFLNVREITELESEVIAASRQATN